MSQEKKQKATSDASSPSIAQPKWKAALGKVSAALYDCLDPLPRELINMVMGYYQLPMIHEDWKTRMSNQKLRSGIVNMSGDYALWKESKSDTYFFSHKTKGVLWKIVSDNTGADFFVHGDRVYCPSAGIMQIRALQDGRLLSERECGCYPTENFSRDHIVVCGDRFSTWCEDAVTGTKIYGLLGEDWRYRCVFANQRVCVFPVLDPLNNFAWMVIGCFADRPSQTLISDRNLPTGFSSRILDLFDDRLLVAEEKIDELFSRNIYCLNLETKQRLWQLDNCSGIGSVFLSRDVVLLPCGRNPMGDRLECHSTDTGMVLASTEDLAHCPAVARLTSMALDPFSLTRSWLDAVFDFEFV